MSRIADSYADTPLLDLLAAYDAQDLPVEATACVQKIMTNHGAEIEEDLPPRTAEILRRRRRRRLHRIS